MSFTDKVRNKTENAVGVAKEKTGEATGDRELQAEGKAEQSKAALKDAGEKLKDAVGNVKDALGGSKS
ncbi:CsbD family protein [Pseudonocardia sp. ICBG1293]|uniref:CsbD family protein n=1 Tax=Pseudonocardia sp. ICBG1293 TaxID=2844382 RepID=UPI001CCE2354|nr:CsbD family protein [Pseudonocardia sp. ICBG1293]